MNRWAVTAEASHYDGSTETVWFDNEEECDDWISNHPQVANQGYTFFKVRPLDDKQNYQVKAWLAPPQEQNDKQNYQVKAWLAAALAISCAITGGSIIAHEIYRNHHVQ
jgi:hypothetical protein